MNLTINKTPEYGTMLFSDIWEDASEFREDYTAVGLGGLQDASLDTLFWLLYARYGNSPIANRSVDQFKVKAMATIFQYGPTWEKRLEIQEKLRGLTDEEIMAGAKQIYNHAYNPGTAPSTHDTEELDYVNEQNVSKSSKSVLEAYSQLWSLLRADVTGDFLAKFQPLFKKFARAEKPLLYITEEGE